MWQSRWVHSRAKILAVDDEPELTDLMHYHLVRAGHEVATAANGLQAQGALSQALNTQLASDEAGAVRIGVSFRNHDGAYCRTFDLNEGGASGVACRDNNGWSIPLLSGSATGGEVRTAGASTEVLNAVDAMIEGDPLDATAERTARDSDWR